MGSVMPKNPREYLKREFGFITGIAVVEHDASEFRFRCFGATGVVTKYEAAVASDDA